MAVIFDRRRSGHSKHESGKRGRRPQRSQAPEDVL